MKETTIFLEQLSTISMEILGNNKDKQAVAELCEAQIQLKLDSDFLGEDLYMFIQNLDQEINIFELEVRVEAAV